VKIPYDRNADGVAELPEQKMESLPDFMKKSVTWG
jgi:transposase, IS30 family